MKISKKISKEKGLKNVSKDNMVGLKYLSEIEKNNDATKLLTKLEKNRGYWKTRGINKSKKLSEKFSNEVNSLSIAAKVKEKIGNHKNKDIILNNLSVFLWHIAINKGHAVDPLMSPIPTTFLREKFHFIERIPCILHNDKILTVIQYLEEIDYLTLYKGNPFFKKTRDLEIVREDSPLGGICNGFKIPEKDNLLLTELNHHQSKKEKRRINDVGHNQFFRLADSFEEINEGKPLEEQFQLPINYKINPNNIVNILQEIPNYSNIDWVPVLATNGRIFTDFNRTKKEIKKEFYEKTSLFNYDISSCNLNILIQFTKDKKHLELLNWLKETLKKMKDGTETLLSSVMSRNTLKKIILININEVEIPKTSGQFWKTFDMILKKEKKGEKISFKSKDFLLELSKTIAEITKNATKEIKKKYTKKITIAGKQVDVFQPHNIIFPIKTLDKLTKSSSEEEKNSHNSIVFTQIEALWIHTLVDILHENKYKIYSIEHDGVVTDKEIKKGILKQVNKQTGLSFTLSLDFDPRTPKKTKLKINKIDAKNINKIDSNKIDSNKIDSNKIDSNKIDSNKIDSKVNKINKIDSNKININKEKTGGLTIEFANIDFTSLSDQELKEFDWNADKICSPEEFIKGTYAMYAFYLRNPPKDSEKGLIEYKFQNCQSFKKIYYEPKEIEPAPKSENPETKPEKIIKEIEPEKPETKSKTNSFYQKLSEEINKITTNLNTKKRKLKTVKLDIEIFGDSHPKIRKWVKEEEKLKNTISILEKGIQERINKINFYLLKLTPRPLLFNFNSFSNSFNSFFNSFNSSSNSFNSSSSFNSKFDLGNKGLIKIKYLWRAPSPKVE